jgi:hypothetical protein
MYRTCLTIAIAMALASANPAAACNRGKRVCQQCRVSATLIVNCPEDAKVFVAGRPTRTCGVVRQYHLNLLEAHYSVRIEAGKEVRQRIFGLHHGANTYNVRWDDCSPVETAASEPEMNSAAEEAKASAAKAKTAADKAEAAAARADAAAKQAAKSVPPTDWPGTVEGLVTHWHDGHSINAREGSDVKMEGGILKMTKGAFLLPKDENDLVQNAFGGQKKAQQLSVEIVLKSGSSAQSGPARILSYSANINERNFTLGQEGDKLVFRLRTSKSDNNGTIGPNNTPWVTTIETTLPIDRQLTHVVITYQAGELVYYVNGQAIDRRTDITGDLSNWSSDYKVILGDEWPSGNATDGARNWNGDVERFAIYKRLLTPFEVQRQYNLRVSE